MKVDVAGVLVDAITKDQAISKIDEFVKSNTSHYIVTTYSEFLVFAKHDPAYREVLNSADISLPDGKGIVYAANFLAGSQVLTEKISGSKLIWDIAKLAAQRNYSLALVGGEDNVAKQAYAKLLEKFPNLKVNIAQSDRPFDQSIVNDIASSNSDILCIAYAPPKQEKWIAENLQKLNVKVAIGLGGTFDYLAGKRREAPDSIANIGLEWFWRLLTQPWRIKRIWNAVVVAPLIILGYKLHGKSQS
jgi:N-acetylglucosaminyldiphosphoundecaprenol N-acetyl-beta-D-mannosaminyltransferase